jgi:hypothetical protein
MTDIVNIFDAGDPRTDDAGVRIAKLFAAMHMSPLGTQWPRRQSPNMSAVEGKPAVPLCRREFSL